jgi:drug/metabolite transporter, DME family
MLRARLFLIAAALLWSTGGAAIKLASLTAAQVSLGRSLLAVLAFLVFVPAARKLPPKAVAWVPVPFALTLLLFVWATKSTTAANAIFIQDTAPLFVLLLSPWLLGETASRRELWSLPLFLGGLGLFFRDQLTPGQVEGNLLALGSGVAFAFTIVGLRKAGEGAASCVLWGNALAAVMAAPAAFSSDPVSTTDVAILVYLGVFQVAVAYVAFMRGIQRVRAVEASLLILLEPVLNPVWAWLFVGERPGPWAFAGASLILAGTLWQILASLRSPASGLPEPRSG